MLLKNGSTGENVKTIQKLLNLKVDGIFGDNTEKAVKVFQEKEGLKVDGIVGDETYKKLKGFSSNKPIVNKLSGHVPFEVLDELPETMDKFDINDEIRVCHFISQTSHESAGFKYTEENLNYSKEALMSVFKKYFPTEREASQYARKPQKIANKVYGNRMGNGDEESGDGWKYRGRGYIQLTGKNNYSSFNEYVDEDIVENPDIVSEQYSLVSAGWFWYENGLNELADLGTDEDTIKKITKRINGGYNGLDDRIRKFNKFFSILKS